MEKLHLLRVRYAQRIAAALAARGFEPEGLLRKAGIDPVTLEEAVAWMPMSQLARFLDIAVAETGYVTLGLDAGIKLREQHSSFSKLILYAPTLYQSLSEVCDNIAMEDVSARFRITREGKYGWMNCGGIDASGEGVRQIECYRYAAIVEIVRCAAGPDWLPPLLRFQAEAHPDIAGADLLQGVDVKFNATGLKFAIEPSLLSRPMFDVPNVPAEEARFDSPPLEWAAALREIVRTQVLSQRNTISHTAAVLGIAPRTLQRQLAEHGLSFSRLLEYTRVETAKEWLNENDEPIAVIANRLGYKHRTHFSRAFRRVCGVSPREYRNLKQ